MIKPRVTVVGWHLDSGAAKCYHHDVPAHVVVTIEGEDYTTPYNLCNDCLDLCDVVADKIDEVFRKEGF